MLVPLCLFVPLIGLSAGGVLHHREHAAAKERGAAHNHRPPAPFGGSGHGGLGNYVGGSVAPYDRQGEEKLRVIKITRTYAIPYPVPVPLKAPHHGPIAPWSSANIGHGNGGSNGGYHGPIDSSYQGSGYHGPTGGSYHGLTDSGYHSGGYHGPTGIADHLPGFPLGGSDISHNSLESTGPSGFFSGHGSDSGNHGYSGDNFGFAGGNHGYSGSNHGYSGNNHGYSGGNHGYSGGNHGYSGGNRQTLQDDVYQRHGYSTAKPFRPSQEYTPPELNDHLW